MKIKINKQKIFKILKIVLPIILILGIIIGGFCAWLYTDKIPRGKMEEITVGDGETIKVGVLSDNQLFAGPGENQYTENFRTALNQLKEQNVEVILHAGDIGDMNSFYSYHKFNEIFEEVYGKDEEQYPERVFVMGNHDMWWNTDYNETYIGKHRKYYTMLGENPYTHKVINGFHFIAVSADGAEYTQETLDWMSEEIDKAHEDTPDKPIFVVTHHNPLYTVYGSEPDWSEPHIGAILSRYENVVSISGHSHFSIVDERSIWQQTFTAFQTQATAYCELEGGRYDAFKGGEATRPAGSSDYPMMLIMNVGKDKTEIHRWSIADNKEILADRLWTLPYPLNSSNFNYTAYREDSNKAPTLTGEIKYNPSIQSPYENSEFKSLPGISFPAGEDDMLVHSYRVVVRGPLNGDFVYFSDFFKGPEHMAKTVDIALSPDLPAGEYNIKVYAIDSYNVESEPISGTITLER